MKRILSLLICATIILSAFSFVMPVYASTEEEAFIEYAYYNDFSDVSDTASVYYGSTKDTCTTSLYDRESKAIASGATGYEYTSDGALRFNGVTKGISLYSLIDIDVKDDDAEVKKAVLSYNISAKFNKDSAYYFAPFKDQYGTNTVAFNQRTSVGGGRGIYSGNNAGGWDEAYRLLSVDSFNGQEYNITLVYDNDSTKINNRDIYINGEYKGTYTSTQTKTEYNYASTGKLELLHCAYLYTNDYIELDDIKAYVYPTELKYELESAQANEVALNFNMIPDAATVIPANFTVKAGDSVITPDTATISAVDPRQVVLTFSEGTLKTGTTYTVSAKNVTAGNNDGDVADSLVLASNPELSFKVSPPKVEWTATSDIYSFDYEDLTVAENITADRSTNGVYEFGVSGLYNIEEVDGKKVLTMQQNAADAKTITRVYSRKENFAAGNYYAFEMKIKTDFSKNPERTMFDIRADSSYGVPFTALNNGVIYTTGGLNESIGTYTDGEWITLKNVYYSTPVSIDLTDDGIDNPVDMLKRHIYVNGQFIKTVYDIPDEYDFKMLSGDGLNWGMGVRVRDKSSSNIINTEGKLYIDYIRYYNTVDTFAAQLSSETDVDTGYISVKFNNTPVEADLTDKIYVEDENGVKVSDIIVPEYVNDFNAEGYAAKVNLWFKDELENGETYKLCINGVTDIAGNTLYQEETFTTKIIPEIENLTISGGIASVTVNEYSEPLTLYVVGYDVVDGVEQMTTVDSKVIKATGTYTTDTAVTGTLVKAFLWKGTKPVIACESASEGNN